MKNILRPLAKSILIPLVLTAAASAANGAIHKIKFLDLVLVLRTQKTEQHK